jgi:hypothetical protein
MPTRPALLPVNLLRTKMAGRLSGGIVGFGRHSQQYVGLSWSTGGLVDEAIRPPEVKAAYSVG